MTVKELIEKLKDCDPNAKVVLKVRGNKSTDYAPHTHEIYVKDLTYDYDIVMIKN